MQALVCGETSFCLDFSDVSVQKHAFSLLTRMIVKWLPDSSPIDTTWRDSFSSFMQDRILPVLFLVPLDSRFNLDDGQSSGILQEICVILKHLVKVGGDGFQGYLQHVMFPNHIRPNCDEAVLRQFMEALKQMDVKQFKTIFRNFCRGLSSKRQKHE